LQRNYKKQEKSEVLIYGAMLANIGPEQHLDFGGEKYNIIPLNTNDTYCNKSDLVTDMKQ